MSSIERRDAMPRVSTLLFDIPRSRFRMDRNKKRTSQFQGVFEQLLVGKELDLYKEDVSLLLEIMSLNLIKISPLCFDGIVDLVSNKRKSKQIVFNGSMWILGNKKNWKENFEAIITDKRITKQGIWIKIQVGDYFGEGNLSDALF